MAKGILNRANRRLSVVNAAVLLSGSYFLSGLFGLLRDRLLAARFGIDGTLDAYFIAFSLPDLLFLILVSGALTVTLLPVLSDRLQKYDTAGAWQIASSLLNLLALLTLISSVLIFIFADPLITLIAPSFDESRHELAVNIMRILALNPFFFSISSVFGTIQQAYGRFFFFALAPVIYNIGIIFGIVYLSDSLGIYGVAIGVVFGAIAQLAIQLLGVVGLGFRYQMRIDWGNRNFRQVLRLIGPRSIDEGIEYLIAVIERAIASGLAVGALTAYQFAFNLKNYPITLIGTAIATAAFPSISERTLSSRSDLLKKEILDIARAILWFAIPAAAGVVIMRGYIVRLLIGFGDETIAAILGWFAVAIIFQSLLRLVTRIFYAQADTKTPLYASLVAIVLNVIAALSFVSLYGIVGLAMAQSLVAVVEVLLLLGILVKRLGNFITRAFAREVLGISLAAALMALTTYSLVRFVFPLIAGETGFFSLAPKFVAIVAVSTVAYVWTSKHLALPEAVVFSRRLRQLINQRLRIG